VVQKLIFLKSLYRKDFLVNSGCYHCYLIVGFCILDSLLCCSTVGYPSDSLASCSYISALCARTSRFWRETDRQTDGHGHKPVHCVVRWLNNATRKC